MEYRGTLNNSWINNSSSSCSSQIFCRLPATTGSVTCSSWDVSRKEGSLSSISRTRSLPIETSYGAGIFQSVSATPKFLSISVNQDQHKYKAALSLSLGLSSSRRILLMATADVSSISGESLGSLTRPLPHPLGAGSETARCGKPRRVDVF
jgi:hypothetical protein